jgi:hypothetical protein
MGIAVISGKPTTVHNKRQTDIPIVLSVLNIPFSGCRGGGLSSQFYDLANLGGRFEI